MTQKPKQRHSMRCETCNNKREVHSKPDYDNLPEYGLTPFVRCLVDNEIVNRDDYKKICARGCASYTNMYQMKSTNSQQHITQREHIIDIEKFDKLIERYVNGTFAFSQSELSETIDEILEISRKCIIEREKSINLKG
jgi:hypothetical protein